MSDLQPYDLKCDQCGAVLGTCDRLTMGGHLCGTCGDAEHEARGLKQQTDASDRAILIATLKKTSNLSDAAIDKLLK